MNDLNQKMVLISFVFGALMLFVIAQRYAVFTFTSKELPAFRKDDERVLHTKNTSSGTSDTCTATTSTEFKVPNIVHYIWYTNKPTELRFDKALSVLSAVKNLKPEAVYFHTNMEPYGKYYEMLKNISIFKIVHREPPRTVLKQTYYETDYADYDRVKVLLEEGGIYLDLDVMVIRSMDELRKHECTLGYELEDRACGGVIICMKGHTFLYLWLNSYYEDHRSEWAYNTGVVSAHLADRFPELVYKEKKKLHRPNFRELKQIWGSKSYPWKENYAIHTWIRAALRENMVTYPSPESIKTMNSTYGEMARDVYYGSPDIISR